MSRVVVLAVALMLMAACSAQRPPSYTAGPPRPAWVDGCLHVPVPDVWCGIGTATGIRKRSLARTTAMNRARAEIAKAIGATLHNKTFDREGQTGAIDETTVDEVSRHVSERVVAAASLYEVWAEPNGESVYAAMIAPKRELAALDEIPGLDAAMKNALSERLAAHREAIAEQHRE